ncbi:MAG: two-component regulator propeller domain-containing protein [Verrucomicrobiota bacterium]
MSMKLSSFPSSTSLFRPAVFGFYVSLLIFPFIGLLPALGQEFSVRYWHTEDGLPDEEINAISQTPDGYLWIGTYNGLARFDGEKFKVFNTESNPELPDSRICNLLTDREGTLWIGTLDGNLTLKKGNHFEPVQPPVPFRVDQNKTRSPGSWLWSFHSDLIIDGEGSIWWQVPDKGIARLKAGLWTVFTPSNGLPSGYVRQIACDHDGHVWVEINGQLYCYYDEQWNLRQPEVQFEGKGAVLAPAVKGGLWVAEPRVSWPVDGGLVRRLENQQWQPPTLTIPPMHSPYWVEVSCLLEDGTGHLWIGANFGGLSYFDRLGQRHDQSLRILQAEQTIAILYLFEDRQGNIWAGSNSGLYRLTPQPLSMLPLRPDNQQIFTTCATPDGTVWVGTETSGVFHYEAGSFTSIGGDWNLNIPQIFCLVSDSQSNLWAGTSSGLFQLRDGRFHSVPQPMQLKTNWISAIFQDHAGTLWFGTATGLFSYGNGNFTAYAPAVDVRCIAEDNTGDLWVGTMGNGLFRLPSGNSRTLSSVKSFPSVDARALLCDQAGTLWVGGWGSGLFRRHQNTFVNFTSADGLPSERIGYISTDNHGRLWLLSNNGIIGIASESLQNYERGKSLPLLWLHFSSKEGLANRLCSSWGQPVCAKTSDGCLWFPFMDQLCVFNPAEALSKFVAPNVLVESLLADGKELSPLSGESLHCVSGTRRFEFHYSAIDLLESDVLCFQYKLEGMDQDWVNAGNRRTAYYSKLPPGNYTFRMMVGERNGRWYEAPTPIQIQVIPRFWEIRWVQILVTICLVLGIAGFFAHKTRREFQRRWEWTEMQNAVERERMRIARDIHDDLGSSLTHIAQLSELAQADIAQPKQAKIHIDEIFTTARGVARSVDEIVWAIDPQNDSLELSVAYILNTAQHYLRTGGIRCRLDLPETLPDCSFSSSIRHHLYLAVREALHNIVKHASASEVQLGLNVNTDLKWLTITIADNGVGFVVTPNGSSVVPARLGAGDGHGLENMMHRLKSVGGRCELVSQPGRGTTIRLIAPMKSPQIKNAPST